MFPKKRSGFKQSWCHDTVRGHFSKKRVRKRPRGSWTTENHGLKMDRPGYGCLEQQGGQSGKSSEAVKISQRRMQRPHEFPNVLGFAKRETIRGFQTRKQEELVRLSCYKDKGGRLAQANSFIWETQGLLKNEKCLDRQQSIYEKQGL